VLSYLAEYKEAIPPVSIIKEKIIEKAVIRRIIVRNNGNPEKPSVKEILTKEILMDEAAYICAKYGENIGLFLRTKNGRCKEMITAMRKEFCRDILSNYHCTQNMLADFFNVNHTSITHYMIGKKLIKK
jgi:hypothetical protein